MQQDEDDKPLIERLTNGRFQNKSLVNQLYRKHKTLDLFFQEKLELAFED
jgi:hypothetical protein